MGARTLHPFPARMAPEIALEAIPDSVGGELTVLDPMCGSGTVLAVAIGRGHRAVGVDIDPLAVMMSRLAVTPMDVDELVASGAQVLAEAKAKPGGPPWGDDVDTAKFVDFWFGPTQKAQLQAVVSAIDGLDDHAVKLALRLAVSRIIVTKSPQASLAADTAHSRPHRVIEVSQYDVYEGFRASVASMARILARRDLLGSGEAELGDARHLGHIEEGSIDLAVTSPPYLNALDYLRGHKLALVWFGYTVGALRNTRAASIGSERALPQEVEGVSKEISDLIRAEAKDPSALKFSMIERYAQDCVAFAGELDRALRDGGRAVLVVGNSTLKGNYIRNDEVAKLAMESAGFSLVGRYERVIPPSRRYMAIPPVQEDLAIGKRMRSEVVLTLEK